MPNIVLPQALIPQHITTAGDIADAVYHKVLGDTGTLDKQRLDFGAFFPSVMLNEDILDRDTPIVVAPFQQDVISLILDERHTIVLLVLPRDFGKSSVVAAYVAWLVGKHHNIRVLFGAANQDIAKKHLARVEGIMRHPNYVRLFGNLIPDNSREPGVNWNDSSKTVLRDRRMPAPTLQAVGADSTMGLSSRCDLMVWDDLQGQKEAYSAADRESLWQWMWKQAKPMLVPGGRLLIAGTRFHPDDVYGRMLDPSKEGHLIGTPGFGFNPSLQKALITDADGTQRSLWPARHSLPKLLAEQAQNAPAFETAYQNNPIDTTESLLSVEWLHMIDEDEIPFSKLTYYWGIDPNLLKGNSSRSDFFAAMVIGVDHTADDQAYLLDMYYARPNEEQVIIALEQLYWRYRPQIVFYEGVAAQYFQQIYVKSKLEALNINFQDANPLNVPKPLRIRETVRYYTSGAVLIRATRNDVGLQIYHGLEPFLNEWVSYRALPSQHDDALDSADMVIRRVIPDLLSYFDHVIQPEEIRKAQEASPDAPKKPRGLHDPQIQPTSSLTMHGPSLWPTMGLRAPIHPLERK